MDVNLVKINPGFVQEALDEVPSWLKDKPNWNKFLEIYAERWEFIDQTLVQLAWGRLLAVATGQALDNIGAEFGLTRGDMNDVQFRSFIGLKVYQGTSTGTRPNIEKILELLTGFTPRIYKGNLYYVQVIVSDICLDPTSSGQQIEDLFPVMTNLELLFTTKSPLLMTSSKDPDKLAKGSVGLCTSKTSYASGLCAVNYTSRYGSNYTNE